MTKMKVKKKRKTQQYMKTEFNELRNTINEQKE